MAKEEKKTNMQIFAETGALIIITGALAETFVPGFTLRTFHTISPYLGGGMVLGGLGLLVRKLKPSKEQPHKIMESIFKRCNIAVKEDDQIYYPVLIEKTKTDNGWFLLYSLPPGLSGKHFADKLDVFQSALGGVEIELGRGVVGVSVNQRPLKEKVNGQDWLEQGGDGD